MHVGFMKKKKKWNFWLNVHSWYYLLSLRQQRYFWLVVILFGLFFCAIGAKSKIIIIIINNKKNTDCITFQSTAKGIYNKKKIKKQRDGEKNFFFNRFIQWINKYVKDRFI